MEKPTIGIIGAGKLGLTLAQLASKAGYNVLISSSRPAEQIELTVEVLAPGAQAKTTAEVGHQADLLILALPLGKFTQLPFALFTGKVVIDAMNYWWEVDGRENTFSDLHHSSSERVQSYLPHSTVIKAFNHMGYHDLADEARPEGAVSRKAIAIAGDNLLAVKQVEYLLNDFGFDSLYLGELHEGIRLEPGSELFGANLTLPDLKTANQQFYDTAFGQAVKSANLNQ